MCFVSESDIVLTKCFMQAGEFFIENVLKGKGTEKRTKNLVTDELSESEKAQA